MTEFTVKAEYDVLDSLRVHEPGFETFAGIVDPKPNLFRSDFSIIEAQKEHRRMVEVLQSEGIDVHYLSEDLAKNNYIDGFLEEIEIEVNCSNEEKQIIKDIRSNLKQLGYNEKLQLVACNATIYRDRPEQSDFSLDLRKDRLDASSIKINEPLSNIYFQRDQQLVTDIGPVMASPSYDTRSGEVNVCKGAWQSIDADIVLDVPDQYDIEGGDYIPAGEFALLGISPKGEDNSTLRTSHEAAQYLLKNGVFGHEEVALVQAPIEADKKEQELKQTNKESAMEIMHLDTWFNIAKDGTAVARKPLVEAANVEIYHKTPNGYEFSHESKFITYLREKDYNIIPVEFDERSIATNFLTLDDGKVLAPRFDLEQNNKTIEKMKSEGIDIVPNGEGIEIDELRSGYGGIHCMVTPLRRK